jgi:hypothetical protein
MPSNRVTLQRLMAKSLLNEQIAALRARHRKEIVAMKAPSSDAS